MLITMATVKSNSQFVNCENLLIALALVHNSINISATKVFAKKEKKRR